MGSRLLWSALVGAWILAALGSSCSLRGEEPERRDILFVRETAKGDAIYLMSHDGREVRRLVEGTAPRWSPDGTRFAYLVDDYGKTTRTGTSLWVMNPDTGKRRRLLTGDRDVGIHSFAWAPDGVRITYQDLTQILVVNTETGTTELVSLEFLVDGPLDWSPDGRELLVSRTASVKILDLRSGVDREVAPRRWVSDGRWSPDGERIALAQGNPSWNAQRNAFDLPANGRLKGFIVVAGRDGGNSQRLTDGAWDSQPSWSSDGERIYFSRQPAATLGEEDQEEKREIYVVDVESRSLRRLTENGVADRSPEPRPTRRSLPDVPEPITGEILVPDLIGRQVLFEDERRRFEELGLELKAVFPPEKGVLAIIREQAPLGGSRVTGGRVVTINLDDLAYFYEGRAFSARVWKAHPGCGEDSNPRGPMYRDLVRRVLRRGMSKERLFSLLGDPERSKPRTFEWPLGRRSFVPVDCIYLRVELDRRGRATRFHQWQS